MTENGFLIIFCGLPSSGKTTTAQNLKIKLEENYKNNISIIDTDILRIQKYGNEFTPDNEIKIRESALIQVRDLLLQGHIVLSDDINYFESMRHEFVQIAQELNLPFFIIYISTPLEQCLKWNRQRATNIDDEVILRIYQKFDIPGKKYKWDVPLMEIDYSKPQKINKIDEIIAKINEIINQKGTKNNENTKIKKKNNLDIIDNLTRKFIGFYRAYYSNQLQELAKMDKLTKEIYVACTNDSELKRMLEIIVLRFKNDFIALNTIRKKFLKGIRLQESKKYGNIKILRDFLSFLEINSI